MIERESRRKDLFDSWEKEYKPVCEGKVGVGLGSRSDLHTIVWVGTVDICKQIIHDGEKKKNHIYYYVQGRRLQHSFSL